MIWIATHEAMRRHDNPLVQRALEQGEIGFVHLIPEHWTARAAFEWAIAKAFKKEMANYHIPVVFTKDFSSFQPLMYERTMERPDLIDASQVLTGQGKPYQKFTPFYKKALQLPFLKAEPTIQWKVQTSKEFPEDDSYTVPEWVQSFQFPYTTEEEVGALLATLDLTDYALYRDRIERQVVSQLSPAIAVGLVTVRTLVEQGLTEAAFVRQLIWRSFSQMTLANHPSAVTEPLYEKYATFPWRQDEQAFLRWKKGQTGYPIVDAAMRELWATGWMHNRNRMIVASFLTKHLGIDWRLGAAYFMETLIDADLANNTINWQWVAGVGVDSSPYFRIFNPIEQGKKFASTGRYIEEWCPEYKEVHAVQDGALIPHEWGRKRALMTYHEWKDGQNE